MLHTEEENKQRFDKQTELMEKILSQLDGARQRTSVASELSIPVAKPTIKVGKLEFLHQVTVRDEDQDEEPSITDENSINTKWNN